MLGQRWARAAQDFPGARFVADANSVDAAREAAIAAKGRVVDPRPYDDANEMLLAAGKDALFEALKSAEKAEEDIEQDGPEKGLQIVLLDDWVTDYQPPDYVIDGILQRNRVYSFTAGTGHGKTAAAIQMAFSVAEGTEFCRCETQKGGVLYLAGENDDDVRGRCVAAIEHYGIAPRIGFVGGIFDIAGEFERIAEEAAKLAPLALVIVDTLQAYFAGDDDNSNPQMLQAARVFRRLSELPGRPAVLVPCHPVKNARKDNLIPRGGSAFLNEVDGNLTIWRDEALAILHTQGKFRGPLFEPLTIEFETVTSERLKDKQGRLMPTVLAKPVSELRACDLEKQADTLEQRALQAIQGNPKISSRGLADQLGCGRTKANELINRLKRDKLIKKRAKKLELTDEGREVLDDQ